MTPVRIPQTRTTSRCEESQTGLLCPDQSTRCTFQNLIHDAFNRRSGIDYDTTLRDIFFRCVQSPNEAPFGRSSAPLSFRPLGKPSGQCVQIDLENKNPIEQIDEAREIPGAAAEE